jgi:hypothetical protein
MNIPLVFEIMKCLDGYYLFGLPNLQRQYKGEAEMSKIVSKKIVNIQAGKGNNWTDLMGTIKEKVAGELFDRAYYQFPSYDATIELEKGTKGAIELTTNLNIGISLLGNYYTVYFEDLAKARGFSSDPSNDPTWILYYSKKAVNGEALTQKLNDVRGYIEQHFIGFTFVPHDLLFTYKIKHTLPFQISWEFLGTEYPIYDFLFQGRFSYEGVKVLE